MSHKAGSFLKNNIKIAILCVFVICGSIAAQQTPTNITIFHTNDMHAAYLPTVATWESSKPMIGGFEALDYYVHQERASAQRSLLLDAGDLMTGTLICDIPYEGAYGGGLVAMMNMIGYDGWVMGNHEFDKSASNLRALIKIAKFPVFCANLVKDGQLFTKEGYHIYNVDGLKVGVIGLTYHQMVGMASKNNLDGFYSLDPIPVVKDCVSKIDSLTDLIIVLSHLGIENDRELAQNVKGIDLIVGGHSHTRIETPEVVNGVVIVQTGSNCRNLGRVDMTVAGDTIMMFRGKLIPMYSKDIKPNPEITKMVSEFKAEVDKDYNIKIAQLNDTWKSEYRSESNVGDWLSEALRQKMQTDVAFINSGGIRKDIEAGPVTKMDIKEMLPFDNKVVTFECTGADLIRTAEKNIGAEKGGSQGSLQISGLCYTWKEENDQPKVVDVMIGGKAIDPNGKYTVATIDYVATSNSDRYLGFSPQNIKPTELQFTDIVMEAVEKAKTIDSKIEKRISKIE